MTIYDSSVLINYLDGDSAAIEYVQDHLDERAVVPPLVRFEVYQGEVYKTGPPDFDAVDRALEWLDTIEATADHARAAAELQSELHERGDPLAARDALIAGTAVALDERLAVADTDFDVDGIRNAIALDVLDS